MSTYWFTSTAASSARLYWESFGRLQAGGAVDLPSGITVFPKEIFPSSRRWVEHRLRDLRHYNELDRGGHFAAMEQPAVFTDELRTFFRTVR